MVYFENMIFAISSAISEPERIRLNRLIVSRGGMIRLYEPDFPSTDYFVYDPFLETKDEATKNALHFKAFYSPVIILSVQEVEEAVKEYPPMNCGKHVIRDGCLYYYWPDGTEDEFFFIPETADTISEDFLKPVLCGEKEMEQLKRKMRILVCLPQLKDIEQNAFCGTELKQIELNGGLQRIGPSAFAATEIEEISLPDSLKCVNGFDNCLSLKKVILPRTCEGIAAGAFENCISLTMPFDMPDSMKWIGDCAFRNSGIAGAKTACMHYIGKQAFADCLNLEEIVIEGEGLIVGPMAFSLSGKPLLFFANHPAKLKTLLIGTGVTEIRKNCFQGRKNIETVCFLSGQTRVSFDAFEPEVRNRLCREILEGKANKATEAVVTRMITSNKLCWKSFPTEPALRELTLKRHLLKEIPAYCALMYFEKHADAEENEEIRITIEKLDHYIQTLGVI